MSHDLAVVASIADHVAGMYEGSIVEGNATQVFSRPQHEYTRRLVVHTAARQALDVGEGGTTSSPSKASSWRNVRWGHVVFAARPATQSSPSGEREERGRKRRPGRPGSLRRISNGSFDGLRVRQLTALRTLAFVGPTRRSALGLDPNDAASLPNPDRAEAEFDSVLAPDASDTSGQVTLVFSDIAGVDQAARGARHRCLPRGSTRAPKDRARGVRPLVRLELDIDSQGPDLEWSGKGSRLLRLVDGNPCGTLRGSRESGEPRAPTMIGNHGLETRGAA